MTTDTGAMTKGERNDLARLVRHRERLSKTAASQRSAELLADVERQLGTIYHFDEDEVWEAANSAVDQAVAEAIEKVAKRCKELGIHKRFGPIISKSWYGRGENALAERRVELRRMAVTRIAAMEKAARTAIETHSLGAQTELLAGGLTSDAAKLFLEKMPAVETLMPMLNETEIKGLLGDGGRP